jgi:type I restriction enzyme S subunit
MLKYILGETCFAGDILPSSPITGGSIGRCFYVTNEFEEANVNQHVCIVRPNERIITEFLYYVLSSTIGQQQIDLCQTGGNREALNFEQLKNFFLILPSIDEQHEIVEKLSKSLIAISLTIEKTRKEIDLINEYKTALISEVVTGKLDVREKL